MENNKEQEVYSTPTTVFLQVSTQKQAQFLPLVIFHRDSVSCTLRQKIAVLKGKSLMSLCKHTKFKKGCLSLKQWSFDIILWTMIFILCGYIFYVAFWIPIEINLHRLRFNQLVPFEIYDTNIDWIGRNITKIK